MSERSWLDELTLDSIRGRAADKEYDARQALAEAFDDARVEKGWSLRHLAEKMETSLSQVQRILNRNPFGSIRLESLFCAAEALELDLTVGVRRTRTVGPDWELSGWPGSPEVQPALPPNVLPFPPSPRKWLDAQKQTSSSYAAPATKTGTA